MKRALAVAFATCVTASTIVLGSAGGASAAHCTDAGGPGSSDFGAHARVLGGPGGAHESEGFHRGWSTCEENSVNYAP